MQKNIGFVNSRSLSWSHKATENQGNMMTANKEGISLEHDTTICGDPKEVWLPMRVTYSRELKVKAELDRLEIENLISMMHKLMDEVEFEGIASVIVVFVPAVIARDKRE